jgi:hypothetical protein
MSRLLYLASALALGVSGLYAQAPASAPQTAKQAAPIDLTGTWVSVVTEDWRWRMVTPPKGDFANIPLTPEARRVANLWDPARVEAEGSQCAAYGAGSISKVPGRLRISWQDDSTLKAEYDTGTQTRLLHFSGSTPAANEAGSWQGITTARWDVIAGARNAPPQGGSLTTVTTKMKPGFLRKNGVPYSADATVTDYWDLLPKEGSGSQWIIVSTAIEDPVNLNQRYLFTTNFKKEPDGSKFAPSACTAK